MTSLLHQLLSKPILRVAFLPSALTIICQLAMSNVVLASDANLAKAPVKNIAAVRLLQESAVDGKFEVVASAVGVRLKSFKGGYELFSAAPDWQVYAVRADAKEVAHLSLAEWKKFFMPSFRMAGVTANFKAPEKTIVTVDAQGKKYEYLYPGSGVTSSGWSGWTEKNDVLRYIITSRDYFETAPVGAIVSRYMNLPVLKGMPISLISVLRVGKREEKSWTIRTISNRSEIIADSSYFRPPAKLKDAGPINSQYISRGISGLADDMSEMLDVRGK
ncbi:hypothetical protein KA344_11345 [bacterium]|jgi:hypothetical protein|nr:hypothetical protein [bacterium]